MALVSVLSAYTFTKMDLPMLLAKLFVTKPLSFAVSMLKTISASALEGHAGSKRLRANSSTRVIRLAFPAKRSKVVLKFI